MGGGAQAPRAPLDLLVVLWLKVERPIEVKAYSHRPELSGRIAFQNIFLAIRLLNWERMPSCRAAWTQSQAMPCLPQCILSCYSHIHIKLPVCANKTSKHELKSKPRETQRAATNGSFLTFLAFKPRASPKAS